MPRIRYLKPEFFSDEDLAKLPHSTRLTFAGLWCWADREGRLEDRPEFLKAMIFPYPTDAKIDIEKELQRLCDPKSNGSQFINRYLTDGKRYIQILSWKKHQSPHHTEKESKIPPAPPLTTKDKEKEKDKCASPEYGVTQPLHNGELTVKDQIIKKIESFQKPTLNEITHYCQERKNSIDPEKFFSYYESNGWKVGRNQMKSWRAAVITWEKSNFNGDSSKKPRWKSNFF